MKSGSVDEKTMRNFSQDIYNESQRMILLVNDILKLSKLDEESITMEKEEICMEEICRDVIKSLKIFAQRKNVSIELESHTKDCIKGVPTVIQEMILISWKTQSNTTKKTEKSSSKSKRLREKSLT